MTYRNIILSFLLAASLTDASAGVARPPIQAKEQPVLRSTASAAPGREADGRVAAIAFRLAQKGRARCSTTVPALGMVLQHLLQFEPRDRPGMITALHLDRGPGVIAIVPGSPAAAADIRPGDVLLAIDGVAFPPEEAGNTPFASSVARSRADLIHDLLERSAVRPFTITLLRSGNTLTTRMLASPACPARVHLARSTQRNAFADGTHVFLTTGLLSQLDNDDELAFFIAHEIAHNILGHASIMRGAEVNQGVGRTLGRSGEIVRATERAADALGGELMLDAGFDPVAGAGALRRLGGIDIGIALFASHAPAGERIAAMKALVKARRAR